MGDIAHRVWDIPNPDSQLQWETVTALGRHNRQYEQRISAVMFGGRGTRRALPAESEPEDNDDYTNGPCPHPER